MRTTARDRLAHREYVSFTTMNIMGGPDGLVQVLAATPAPEGQLMEDPVGHLIDQFDMLEATVMDLIASFFGGCLPKPPRRDPSCG